MRVRDEGSATPSFQWDTAPAREVNVFRCTDACPAIESLPTENGAVERNGLDQVWRLYAFDGVEAGEGAILSPVTVGQAPQSVKGRKVEASGAPERLKPGRYLVRVVLARGSAASGEWGIRWAGFRVD